MAEIKIILNEEEIEEKKKLKELLDDIGEQEKERLIGFLQGLKFVEVK